jgi:tetratricopeptide (TPR) repeat protein
MGTLPTISLALIAKNEEKNINRLLDSVEGCFHEIILTDTGSTDKTKEIAIARGCKVSDFEWVNDFSKARNFAFSQATKDFVMWLDLDDVLSDKKGFIQWRDTAMQYNDFVFATYNYALDKDGKPIVSFVRERVMRRSIAPQWRYPLHEGVLLKPEWRCSYATTWAVNHMRDMEDIAQDKSRNIKILEEMKDLDGRMHFYYGKELYEAQRPFEALPQLEKAVLRTDLEPHDKMLAFQYACYAAMACASQLKDEMRDLKNQYLERAVDACLKGIRINPHRAELYIGAADAYIQMGRLQEAIPFYGAAKHCINPKSQMGPYEGAIYSFINCYGELPL